MSETRDDRVAVNKKTNEPVTLKNEEILKLAKQGMIKYRKTLDKLAKN